MKPKYEILCGYKRCNICKKMRHITEYNKCSHVKSGIRGNCKQCQAKTAHKNRVRSKERIREVQLKYGLSPEDYLSLVDAQMNKCALCGKHRKEQQRDLHVDHNHITGRVRGLLCVGCNVRLGWYEKRKDLIQSYLVEAK